jgi:tetratricopeptide (TPR) repeat protein
MLGPYGDAIHVRAIGALSILTRILYDRGRVDEARTRAEDADHRLRGLSAGLHPLMCGPLLQVAQTLHFLGKPFDALEWAEKGLELGEGAYGKHHPLVAGTHCVLGQIHHRLGNFEQALVHFREAIASAESAQAHVDQHVAVAACFSAAALLDLNRPEEAREAVAAAERLLAKTFGARRQMQGHVALARGRLDVFEGRTDAALRHFEQASAAFSADGGKQHPALIEVLGLYGETALVRADEAGALAAYEAGLQVAQQHRLGDHPTLAAIHLSLAKVHEHRGHDTLARRHRERAREICETALAGPGAFPERILTTRLDALRRLESIA